MPFSGEKAKNILLSKTFWGAIVAVFAVFSDDLGLKLENSIDNIVGFIGAALAIFGRLHAKTPVAVNGEFVDNAGKVRVD